MEKLITAVKISLDTRNFYSALALALSLPDIAGRIEYPGDGSQKRSIQWFNKYLSPKYTVGLGTHHESIFLTGNDCYALRCSLLHEGNVIIEHQPARRIVTRFIFTTTPEKGGGMHMNKVNGVLQLDVSIFCTDIMEAIDQWIVDISDDKTKADKLQEFILIQENAKSVDIPQK